MTLEQIQEFFKWCTIINFGLMIFSVLMIFVLRDMAYKIHGKLFKLSEENINKAMYYFLGFWKILIFVFCAIPWIATSLI